MPNKLFNALMLSAAAVLAPLGGVDTAAAQSCPAMRKINVGVSVAPPNVVHTSPYVAKELGFFAKRCIDANIIQFEGGQSQTSNVAAAQGSAIVSVSDVSIGRGLKVQQIWGLAPRMPQAYMVPAEIKAAADLKGKRLSATGGGVGGFNWRMGRAVLKSAGLDIGDAQFIPSPTAGRLPGLVAGQIDGVALHPEDVFLAKQQKASLHALVQLVELMPLYMFNAYGASTEWIARDRALLRDAVAAMIEANRAIYRERDKVVPVIVEATKKPKDAVEFAIDSNIKNCVWSVNTGFDPKRTQWSIDNSVENGDVEAAKKPTVEQVANAKLAEEAMELAGGRVTIGNCTE
ncbi:MAG: ABC transporter substrate-binding protein [Xanthobacteraceae bacterium]|nr:ABC transporter substrate-binding protein [Xanthobacteraceae bacterium]